MRALIDYLARARSRQPFARRVGRPPVAFGRRLKDEAESKAKKPLKGARKLIESGLRRVAAAAAAALRSAAI